METFGTQRSAVGRHFVETNEVLLIFRNSVSFHIEETTISITAIVMVSHCASTVVREEVIFLVVTRAEILKLFGFRMIADGANDHSITFLTRAEADVFHSLNEGSLSARKFACRLLEMHSNLMLRVNVVARPVQL